MPPLRAIMVISRAFASVSGRINTSVLRPRSSTSISHPTMVIPPLLGAVVDAERMPESRPPRRAVERLTHGDDERAGGHPAHINARAARAAALALRRMYSICFAEKSTFHSAAAILSSAASKIGA